MDIVNCFFGGVKLYKKKGFEFPYCLDCTCSKCRKTDMKTVCKLYEKYFFLVPCDALGRCGL